MSIKDFSNAWDDAVQHALENSQESELIPENLSNAAGLHVRSGLAAGEIDPWALTGGCTRGICQYNSLLTLCNRE